MFKERSRAGLPETSAGMISAWLRRRRSDGAVGHACGGLLDAQHGVRESRLLCDLVSAPVIPASAPDRCSVSPNGRRHDESRPGLALPVSSSSSRSSTGRTVLVTRDTRFSVSSLSIGFGGKRLPW